MKEVTLVWQRERSRLWEVEWIEYLFRNIPHQSIENPNQSVYLDNSVVIDTPSWGATHGQYINNMVAKGLNFGAVHINDERFNDNLSWYSNCKFVIRSFYRGQMPDNVMYIPIGYTTGFTQYTDNPPVNQRSNTWAFVGQRWDKNREIMVNQLQSVSNGCLHVSRETPEFPKISSGEMGKIYRNSIFVPCPGGWAGIETFRTNEALEAGCIPVVPRHPYWAGMHGDDVPFVQVDTWQQAAQVINEMMSDLSKLEKFRLHCSNWWINKKNKTTNDLTEFVAAKLNLK